MTNIKQIYIAKNEATLECDWDDLPEVSKNYIINYGFKKVLNDAHSGVKEGAECEEIARKKLNDLLNGVIRVQRASISEKERETIHQWVLFISSTIAQPQKVVNALIKKEGFDKVKSLLCSELGIELVEKENEFDSIAEKIILTRAQVKTDLPKLDISMFNLSEKNLAIDGAKED